MARNQRGQLPVMSRKQERQTDHADSGRQGYECGWRLSFRPARSALRSWAVGYFGVRVPDLRLPSRSELLSQSTVQRLSADGGALLAQAANRIAGALYGDDDKRLTPEVLIAAAAKATRLDAKPLADPRLVEALGALTSSLHKEASLSPFGRLATSWDLKRSARTGQFSRGRLRRRSSLPAFPATARRSCTDCWRRIQPTAPREYGRRSIPIPNIGRPSLARGDEWCSCSSVSPTGSRPGSETCIRSRPTPGGMHRVYEPGLSQSALRRRLSRPVLSSLARRVWL
jgi:hypothetical protein